jgi:hypothetical protein
MMLYSKLTASKLSHVNFFYHQPIDPDRMPPSQRGAMLEKEAELLPRQQKTIILFRLPSGKFSVDHWPITSLRTTWIPF